LTVAEFSEGTAALSPEIFGVRSTPRPPIVRYGTVLHSAFLSDTTPYQKKFLSKLLSYLSGTYHMQALTIEQRRNSCGLRLPAGSRHADSQGYARPTNGARARWANCAQ
jgi:hypothetical protein